MADFKKIILSETVFDYLKPTIFFMRLFGLAPFSYERVRKYYVIERSTKYTIYSFVLASILGSITILGVIYDATSDRSLRMKTQNQKYIVITDIGIVVWSVLLGVVISQYKLEQVLNVLRCIQKVSTVLKEPKNKLKKEKNVALTIGLSVYFILILIFGFDIYGWITRCKSAEERTRYFKYYSAYYILYLVVISQEISYCNFTYYVKNRIIVLNAALLKEIKREPDIFLHKRASSKGKIDPLVSPKLLIGTEGDVLENYILKSAKYSARNELTPLTIRNFMTAHAEIYNAVNSINACFGYSLLFILISCLLHLVITPFFLITGSQSNPLFTALQATWILVHFGRLLIIVEPTHRCLEENEKTNPLIVYLLSKVQDKEVKNEVSKA
ncbi:hypothetical protein HHI36_021861 [Cryptolaemus montrouzieri]|uniref:Gustatory receptor n=1 Tax=Cryptolaemus montrouzieri TaxID=559131 RepID=A0ABD2MZ13_9CUCU